MKMVVRATLALAVTGVICASVFFFQYYWRPQDAEAQGEVVDELVRRVPVVTTAAREMTFEEKVVVSGNVQAKNFALVSARIPGSLDALFVDEGDVVEAGKTELFQTDSLKLKKAVAIAQQGLSVAECSVNEKEASLEQMQAGLEQADVDLRRYEGLGQHNAVPKQLVEQQASSFKQAAAMVKHAEALLELEKNKLEQSRLSLTMAEKDLDDSLVLSPISGRVSERFMEPGEMAAAGTPVVKIEDISTLEISVYIPEEYYAQVVPGEAKMRIEVGGIQLGSHPVTYKSPTVHAKLRTFEVQGIVENPPPGVVPGCLAEVSIVLNGRTAVGIPTSAIQRRGDKKVAFVLDGEMAQVLELETGRDSDGWTEVKSDNVTVNTPIITMGQTLVDDGTPVSLVKEGGQ